MTKKILLAMSAITMLFATSCEKTLSPDVAVGETSTVSFNIGTPEMVTRAYSDGATATVLQYAVYDETGAELTDLRKTDAEIHGSTTVEFQLTTGNTYSVIFWAAAPNAPYSVDFTNKKMTVNYANAVSNDESRDAFYVYHTFTVSGTQTEKVVLKRPFAQLNIGTNDYAASKSAGYEPKYSFVKVPVSSELNLVTGAVDAATEVEFKLADIPTGETFPVRGYEYLAMNYLLVGAEKEVVDVTFGYSENNNGAEKTRTVGSVPVQRNYRTNIYGQLLTSDVDVNVEINPDYNEPSHVADALYLAAAVGGEYTLTEDVILPETLNVQSNMVLNLNGKTITGPSEARDSDGNRIHVIVNNAELSIIGGTIKSVAENGGSAIYNYGSLELNNTTIEGAPSNTTNGYASYAINSEGASSKLIVNNSNISGRGTIGATEGTKVEINGGNYYTPEVAWGHAIYAIDEGTEVVINDGVFSEGYAYDATNWGMYQIYSGKKAKVVVKGGDFSEPWDCANGFDLCTAEDGVIEIYGGKFAENPSSQNGKNYVADGYYVNVVNGKYEVNDYILTADTEGLQAALDAATDGTTIHLTAGVTYGVVYMGRPTKSNNTRMICGTHSFETTDESAFAAHLSDGAWHTTPKYITTLKNVTIIGAEGATVAGLVATSGHAYANAPDHVHDYVLDVDKTGSAYYNTLHMENIKFSNVAFTGKIDINTSDAESTYNGVIFENCTFTTGGTASNNGAAIRYYNESNNGNVKNIVVKNSKFSNCYQGVYVHHVNGITITDNEFDTTGHNAIAMQGHDGAVDLKAVVIKNNTFKNINDRVIRFNNVGADSQITIQYNTATASGDDAGEVIKANSIAAGVTTNIGYNSWDFKSVVNPELRDTVAKASTTDELKAVLANPSVNTVYLGEGKFVPSLYSGDIPTRKSLTIVGAGADKTQFAYTGSHYAGQFSLTGFDSITIRDCEVLKRENVKDWGMVVFGSSNNANGVYSFENCTFNGVGTQGIFINEEVSGATYNILNCTFNGDFGGEGVISIQNNDGVNHTVNVKGCTFNNVTSNKICVHYPYDGWTLNTDLPASDIHHK